MSAEESDSLATYRADLARIEAQLRTLQEQVNARYPQNETGPAEAEPVDTAYQVAV